MPELALLKGGDKHNHQWEWNPAVTLMDHSPYAIDYAYHPTMIFGVCNHDKHNNSIIPKDLGIS